MMRLIPWALSALFALLWWRGRSTPPPPRPPAALPEPQPRAVPVIRVAPAPLPVAEHREPPPADQPRPSSRPAREEDPGLDIENPEPGAGHLAARRGWVWVGAGLVVVFLAVLLLSSAYNRIPVTPDPLVQVRQGLPADGPSTLTALGGADPARAPALFHSYGCVACHVIPGVSGASGRVGPNLAHLYDHALIAGVLDNTPGNLVHWIRYPQQVSPRTGMPNLGVSEQDARDIAAYLQTVDTRTWP